MKRLTCAAGIAFAMAAAIAPAAERDWRTVARTDLEAARRVIETAHPGAIDEENPAFRQWLERGYVDAMRLSEGVAGYDDAIAAVRYYVAGFRDPHLAVSDGTRPATSVTFAGWAVHRVRGKVEVTGIADAWPDPLPTPGAALIDCDGRSPDELVDADVAPYLDRRPALHDAWLGFLSRARPSFIGPLHACTFARPDGSRTTLPFVVHPVPYKQWFDVLHAGEVRGAPGPATERFGDTLWVRLISFGLGPDAVKALRIELEHAPRDVRAIVFDVRGNDGGNSAVGDMAFETLTGGLDYDERRLAGRPPTYALWRVSSLSVAKLDDDSATVAKQFGTASAVSQMMAGVAASARRALATHEPWVLQFDGDHRIERADIASVGGHLRSFRGTIAVLTDSRCVSACLDFVDTIRLVPGSLHLGRTTDSDTDYIDVARPRLPSGNTLIVPVKVWRNRVRASGERLVPDRAFDGEIGDDAQVRPWALDAIRDVR